jgi:hypothetical protein
MFDMSVAVNVEVVEVVEAVGMVVLRSPGMPRPAEPYDTSTTRDMFDISLFMASSEA